MWPGLTRKMPESSCISGMSSDLWYAGVTGSDRALKVLRSWLAKVLLL